MEEATYSLSPLWDEIRAELRHNRAVRAERKGNRPRTRTDSARTHSARTGSGPELRLIRRRARDGSGQR
jgi:hypothetical protein